MKGNTPEISVIIAAVNATPMIEECLVALATQKGDVSAEVIVSDVTGEETERLIRERFPWVKLISFRERLTIPALRAIGLAQSKGQYVVIIEDHCVPQPDWYEEIIKAHRGHPECIAVGGAIENGCCDSLLDWAVFLSEYSPYMKPLPKGVVHDIPGNNVSYKRRIFSAMNGLGTALKDGFWETTLHKELLAKGERFWMEPSIVVYHKKHFKLLYALSQRYHYSRYYAGILFARSSWPKRLFRCALSLTLPAVLMTRVATRVVRKRRNMRELMLSTPFLIMLTTVWAIAEAVGWLLGPGQSLSKVE